MKKPLSFWVYIGLRFVFKAITISSIVVIFNTFGGGLPMSLLLIAIVVTSYGDGYWKGINK